MLFLKDFQENEKIMLSNVLNPDPYIMQIAVTSLKKQHSERFELLYQVMAKENRDFIHILTERSEKNLMGLLLSDKVTGLKNNFLFASISLPEIARIVEQSGELMTDAGHSINLGGQTQEILFYVLKGAVYVLINDTKVREVKENDLFWGIDREEEGITIISEARAYLLVLNPELIFDIMAENSDYTKEVIGILSKTA
jgi:hypothetical protein